MTKTTTIDEYLERLPPAQRVALERLRRQIKSAAPGVEEYIGYGLCAVRLAGHPLLYFGAATHHCALYGALDAGPFAKQLAGFKQSKGTIQFTPDRPLPAALVKAIVKARVAAHRAKWGATKATKGPPAKAKKPGAAKARALGPAKS